MIPTLKAMIADLEDAGITFQVCDERLMLKSDLHLLHEIANNSIADFLLQHEDLAIQVVKQKSPSNMSAN